MTISHSFPYLSLLPSPRVIMCCNPHRFAVLAATHFHTQAWQTLKSHVLTRKMLRFFPLQYVSNVVMGTIS